MTYISLCMYSFYLRIYLLKDFSIPQIIWHPSTELLLNLTYRVQKKCIVVSQHLLRQT